MSNQEEEFPTYSYQEQLAKCKDPTDDFGNVWRNKNWTIADYEQLFEDIDRGYIIQETYEGNYFVINEDYEEEKFMTEKEFYETEKCITEDGKHDVVDGHCLKCCECDSCISRLEEWWISKRAD